MVEKENQYMREITFREAVVEALDIAMGKDPRIFILGEDIGYYGGLFQATQGLMQKYGEDRVMDSPISETAILGAGIGSAIVGLRPIVEIMNIDFLPVCLDQLVNQAAKMRYMFGGQCKIPLVVRTTCGAGRGGAAHHAQATHAAYMHFPGLKIVAAGTPRDVKGLLLTAIEDENPVLFIEDKMMYNTKDEVPEGYYTVPFGKAAIRHEGKDITVVATMRMGYKAVAVAKEMAEKGISVEVIDPRTLVPLDEETILASFKKTGKMVIVDEGHRVGNFGNEVTALIAEKAVGYIQAPILKVTAPQISVPYSPVLEKEVYIPNEEMIKKAINKVMEYA
jgi:acetoin:2,6-dichlorophenolindophenol oxidoreductase subunit beta